MNEELKQDEQALADKFDEKLDVTATPVAPASESESFTPEAAPETPATPAVEPTAAPAPETPAQ